MKNIFTLLAVAVIAVAFQSCKKAEQPHGQTVTQTVSETMRMNESYTFTLPANTTDDPYRVTAQPLHASLSDLGKDASGNDVYRYTPTKDYTGTDRAVIATTEEHRGGPNGGNMQGGCQHHNGDRHREAEIQHVVVINFTVTNDAAAAATRTSVR